MASHKTLLVVAAMALVATAALLPATESKKTFKVGDDAGWDVGVDYKAWARGKNFKLGDTLVFRFSAGQDVVQVDEQSFHNCVTPDDATVLGSGTGEINELHVVLGDKGRFFVICDAEGECESGMKLVVNVH